MNKYALSLAGGALLAVTALATASVSAAIVPENVMVLKAADQGMTEAMPVPTSFITLETHAIERVDTPILVRAQPQKPSIETTVRGFSRPNTASIEAPSGGAAAALRTNVPADHDFGNRYRS